MFFTTTHLNHPYHVVWGQYEFLHIEDGYRVKKLTFKKPIGSTSFHHHVNREGFFTVVEGKGKVVIVNDEKIIVPGDTFSVPKGISYAIYGEEGLKIIEVQRGECDELDTYRHRDQYGRTLGYLKDRAEYEINKKKKTNPT